MPICTSTPVLQLLPLDWLKLVQRISASYFTYFTSCFSVWNAFPGFELLQKAIHRCSTAQLLQFGIANCNVRLAMAVSALRRIPNRSKQLQRIFLGSTWFNVIYNSSAHSTSILSIPKNTSQIIDDSIFHILKLKIYHSVSTDNSLLNPIILNLDISRWFTDDSLINWYSSCFNPNLGAHLHDDRHWSLGSQHFQLFPQRRQGQWQLPVTACGDGA